MNMEMNGNKIEAVYWPDTETEKGRCLVCGPVCGDLTFSATYHGDRDEFWIIQSKDGIEIARHNPRYVESITWTKTK